ncbi:hypothetical protein EG328_012097 [Venturia inaequalis]|uniref:Uncharacterized protein n=1 Tax=Venturia inaequalis TaxID=5025 RepID=A0A8H3YK67_VENIN|nr:hypothetical protein EG328_012097 [Venturia inaequalis]
MFAESDRYIYNNGTLEALVGKFYFRAKIRPTRKIIDYVQLFNGVHAIRNVTGIGYNSKIEKAKRKALREGGNIVPTEVEDSADEDEKTDNKSKNSDEEPIIDEEEDSYEDTAPEIISSKEKKELLATKKAYEVEGLELTLYE